MTILNFIEKNATPIGIIAGVVLGGAAAVCTYKAMTKAEKINNEPEEKVEDESGVEKAKALIPIFGIIALSVVGTQILANEYIALATLTGCSIGLAYHADHADIDTVTKNFRLVCAGAIGSGVIGYLFAMRLK